MKSVRVQVHVARARARKTWTWTWTLLLAGCSTMQGALPYYELEAQAPSAGDRADLADAVVLDDRCRMRHFFDAFNQETRIDCRRAIFIVRQEGLIHAEVQLPEGEGTLTNLEGRTILPDGRTVPLEPQNIRELVVARIAGPGGRESRLKVFAFPSAEPGSVIEYRYTIIVPRLVFSYRHRLDDSIPVRAARFELETLVETAVHTKTRGFSGPTSSEPAPGTKVYVWELRDLAPYTREVLRLDRSRTAPEVELAVEQLGPSSQFRDQAVPVYKSWRETLSPLWQQVIAGCGIDSRVKPMPVEDPDLFRVDEIWREVQSAIDDRVAMRLPAFGLRSAKEVWGSGFGSADERAMLLICKLRRAGYDAGLALLPNRSGRDLDDEMYAPTGFEDWLARIDRGKKPPIFLDPTCLGCAAGELALDHRERRGVWVRTKPSGGGIDTAVFSTAAESSVPAYAYVHHVAFGEHGLILERGEVYLRGIGAARLRHELAQEANTIEERTRVLRRRFLDRHHGGTIEVKGLNQADGPLEVVVRGTLWSRVGMTRAGDYLFEAISDILPLGAAEWLEENRVAPVDFDEGPDFEHHLSIRVPQGHTVLELPEDRKLSCNGGSYTLSAKTSSASVELREKLQVVRDTVSVEDYPEFYKFLEDVRAARRQRVVLMRKPG